MDADNPAYVPIPFVDFARKRHVYIWQCVRHIVCWKESCHIPIFLISIVPLRMLVDQYPDQQLSEMLANSMRLLLDYTGSSPERQPSNSRTEHLLFRTV